MKIVPIFLRYDYGVKSRGDSLEYKGFYSALKKLTDEVYPFWYDNYLTDEEELHQQIIKFVDDVQPTIVFFTLMKDEISFKTLDYLKDKYTTINWFCDDQWRFESFTRYYAPHFTYAITTDKFSLNKYKNIGYDNAILSQWASFGCEKDINLNEINYKYDVSFVGGISRYRKWIVEELLKEGIEVECFGIGWKNGRVSFEEMIEIFKSSKINLNISNSSSKDIRCIFSSAKSLYEFISSKKRYEQIKARNFEIPSFGGFQLTNYVPSLEDYFEIGRAVAVYTSIDDLVHQIYYYLGNEEERRKIMVTGYHKAIYKHNYLNRLQDIFLRVDL